CCPATTDLRTTAHCSGDRTRILLRRMGIVGAACHRDHERGYYEPRRRHHSPSPIRSEPDLEAANRAKLCSGPATGRAYCRITARTLALTRLATPIRRAGRR